MRLTISTWPRLSLLALALAVWPVWRWYFLRTVDGSDEPFGLLALITLAWATTRSGLRLQASDGRLALATFALGAYTVCYAALSPLPRAIVAVTALAAFCIERRSAVAHAALLALSLPVVASVQFYLGYPLRILASEASALALRLLNLDVTCEGTLLHWQGEAIMVDAPCSGVRMLWSGIYVAAALSAFARLSNARSLIVLLAAGVVVIFANVVRATSLFFKEAGIVALPEWTHTGIGVVVFAAAALLIVRLAERKEAACAA